ncbi:hypothetical protein X777_04770, partial [Ooceraea biroi]
KPETASEKRKREQDYGEARSEKGWRGSPGNSGTELVDESVGGYRRLLRRRATSNTEQEGGREEKREANGESAEGGGGAGGRAEPARRIEDGAWGLARERRRQKARERMKPAAVPGPPFYGALISKRQNCI